MNLTNRDIDILKALALGVSNFKMLLRLLNKGFDYNISVAALLRRLSMLYRAGYIARRKEAYRKRHGSFTVYALTRLSADALAETGCPGESMRLGLPTAFFVRHELHVTAVLQTIHRDISAAHGIYSFTDSSVLKQFRKKGDRTPVPDLCVNLQTGQESMDINIEVDLGTVLIAKMVRRIAEQAPKRLLLIMCNNETRLENLRKACSRRSFRGQGNVVFGLLDDFYRHGLQTQLIMISGENARLRVKDD